MKRVVVTGLGTISSAGNNTHDSWNNLIDGKVKISEYGIVNPIHNLNSRISKFIHFAEVACDEAIKNAKLTQNDLKNSSVIIGSGIGGLQEIQNNTCKLTEHEYIEKYNLAYRKTKNVISPFFIISSIINIASSHISMKYGIEGLNKSVVSACASGAHSIIDGTRMIKMNESKCVIVGGTESSICSIGLFGFHAMKALYNGNLPLHKASMPFDQDRAGFVMSEGAGVLILEEYEHAKKRNANIYAEILSYGFSSDASHITKPNMRGSIASMNMALGKIRKNVCVNAHSTSTPLGDESELNAIASIFKNEETYVVSNKGAVGHTLGASGAIEAIFSILSLQNQIVPMNYNLNNCMEKPNNIKIKNTNTNTKIDYVLSNSFGFGGTNASILFSKLSK